ncbi:retrovirus-related pol polyprotein from transposon TNT 1-94 [Tanacetum coccineum]
MDYMPLLKNDHSFWPSYHKDGVTRLKEYTELTPAEAIQADCDIKAINIILQGLPTEIYALVSQHRVAKDLWEKIKLLMQGTSLTKQERECKLYDEFDKFTYKKGESYDDTTMSGQDLTKEEITFLADPGLPDTQTSQTVLTHNVAYQADDLDACDSDCDELNSAKIALIDESIHNSSDELTEIWITIEIPNFDETLMLCEKSPFKNAFEEQDPMDVKQIKFWTKKEPLRTAITVWARLCLKHSRKLWGVWGGVVGRGWMNDESKVDARRALDCSVSSDESEYLQSDYRHHATQCQLLNLFEKQRLTRGSTPLYQLHSSRVFTNITPQEKPHIRYHFKERSELDSTVIYVIAHDSHMYSKGARCESVTGEQTDRSVKNVTLSDTGDYLAQYQTSTRQLHYDLSETNSRDTRDQATVRNDRIQQTPSSSSKNKVEAHPRNVKYSLNKRNGTVRVNGPAFDYVCINSDDCMSSDNLCDSNSINDVKFRAKSKKRKSKKEIWKPTGKITTTNEVPSREPIVLESESSKPVVKLVYSRKPRKNKNTESDSKTKVVQIVLWYLDSGCSKHMTGDRSQLTNFISKFLGTVKFGNDQVAKIMGYGDYQIGNVTISRVYYVEGLGHNLFSVGQFCDSNLEVAFRQHTCFIRNLEGVDLLTGSRGDNLYTLSLGNMMASSPICLLSKASKTKSWLWHRRLSHLNFGAINHLARHGLVRGLPKLKFEKDHLCSACALGKSSKKPHKPKSEDTNQEKLYLLHMDLCGPMRVASVNGKKYILVIVDDYSRFTWVKCLRSKDEAPAFIINFLKMIQVRLKETVRRIRTDNGTEFVNQTLREYYEKVGISHETSVARSPQQNGVVERRNRTLIEAARTMLIYAKAPLFLWAEAVATACYTQNRSMIRRRHGKTPYELLHDKPPDLSYLHVFGALCYPTNDSENLGKLQPKADIGIFIGYAPTKKAFRIYNRRTRRIIETIHVDFDELTAMASEHSSSGPALHEMTPVTISSGLVPNPPSSTPFVPPSRSDWDLLFQPMFDESLNPPPYVDLQAPEVIAPIPEVAPEHAVSTGSPSELH